MHTVHRNRHRVLLTIVLALMLCPAARRGQVSVTTQHNDNWRTGQNTNESHLTTGINRNNFGLLCKMAVFSSAPLQEQAYAQPLVIGNSNGSMTVYVATMQDKIYAFGIPANWNGNCATVGTASRNLLDGNPNESAADCHHLAGGGCGILSPSVGILGTPVIDTTSGTLHVVAESQSPAYPATPTAWYHRIHALDVTSLAEKSNSPATILSSSIGSAIFNSQKLIQRPGLLFLGPAISPTSPTVYVGFSMITQNPVLKIILPLS